MSHGSLASKVGRLLAPHLPQLVPTWLLAMCDTFPSAAAAAKRAFQVKILVHLLILLFYLLVIILLIMKYSLCNKASAIGLYFIVASLVL